MMARNTNMRLPMYKNAGIKTIREAITRLMNGEVFYSEDGTKVFFNDEDKYNPFRYGPYDLGYRFFGFDKWTTEADWRDNVSKENPVLCFPIHAITGRRMTNHPVLIVHYSEISSCPYTDSTCVAWPDVDPVTKEEALKYIAEQ